MKSATACAPVIEGGPPIAPPIGLQDTAQVGRITLSTALLNAGDDFAGTFADEVPAELGLLNASGRTRTFLPIRASLTPCFRRTPFAGSWAPPIGR